jgi:hypothetical protein
VFRNTLIGEELIEELVGGPSALQVTPMRQTTGPRFENRRNLSNVLPSRTGRVCRRCLGGSDFSTRRRTLPRRDVRVTLSASTTVKDALD